MCSMTSHVVVLAGRRVEHEHKTGDVKLRIGDGEGPEYRTLQVLGERTGASAVAIAVSGRRWQD